MIGITRRFNHSVTTHDQHEMIREKTPVLMMPKARPMREPKTGYLTYITAKGPHTVKAW
jgi:hypothetical protein